MFDESSVKQLFKSFEGVNVLVIGDVMIDAYLFGKVNRISPEAPVPVVEVHKRSNRLGGAANVALNIKALGGTPVLCSVIGDEDKADLFESLMQDEGLCAEGICRSNQRITTTKFRILGESTQMLRVDEEVQHELSDKERGCLLDRVAEIIQSRRIGAILFQDYDKGVISPELINKLVELAGKYKIPLSVDPKKRNFLAFQGMDLFKPNFKELREGLNISAKLETDEHLFEASEILREKLNARAVMVTLSDRGMLINTPYQNKRLMEIIPAHIRSISDVSGAGDTVISVATLCLAVACHPILMAKLSNLAGGLVCESVGVVPVDKEKLEREALKLLVS